MVPVMRALVRRIVTWLFVGVLAAIAVSVAAEWFIEVAKDKGLYEDAGRSWDNLMGAITSFVASGWILYPLVGLAGVVVGMWTDEFLKRLERARQVVFDDENEFGRLSFSTVMSGATDQTNAVCMAFRSLKHITDVKVYADVKIRLPQSRSASWQRVTMATYPALSAEEVISLDCVRRDDVAGAPMTFCNRNDPSLSKHVPYNSYLFAIINVSFRAGRRDIIVRKRFSLMPRPFSRLPWPDYIVDIKLSTTSDFAS